MIVMVFMTSLSIMCNIADLKANSIDVTSVEVIEDYTETDDQQVTVQPNDIQFVGDSYFSIESDIGEDENNDLPVLDLNI